jgi:predicted transcriptional regulator
MLSDPVQLATDIAIAWLSNPNARINADDVPGFISQVHSKLVGFDAPDPVAAARGVAVEEPAKGAVSIRKSLADSNFIISMINGKPFKALRRHLSANGMTPDTYRARYGLPATYPMIAPAYVAARSEAAKRLGLGRKPGQKVADKALEAPASAPTPTKRARKPKSISEAKAAARAHLGELDKGAIS